MVELVPLACLLHQRSHRLQGVTGFPLEDKAEDVGVKGDDVDKNTALQNK